MNTGLTQICQDSRAEPSAEKCRTCTCIERGLHRETLIDCMPVSSRPAGKIKVFGPPFHHAYQRISPAKSNCRVSASVFSFQCLVKFSTVMSVRVYIRSI